MAATTAYRVNDGLAGELARFGGTTLVRCFNCGNCTAVCGLSQGEHVFPRRVIRQLQLGLERRLLESTDPWLCYYCGQCSDTCPRQAEPGELMMAARRWLTARRGQPLGAATDRPCLSAGRCWWSAVCRWQSDGYVEVLGLRDPVEEPAQRTARASWRSRW